MRLVQNSMKAWVAITGLVSQKYGLEISYCFLFPLWCVQYLWEKTCDCMSFLRYLKKNLMRITFRTKRHLKEILLRMPELYNASIFTSCLTACERTHGIPVCSLMGGLDTHSVAGGVGTHAEVLEELRRASILTCDLFTDLSSHRPVDNN